MRRLRGVIVVNSPSLHRDRCGGGRVVEGGLFGLLTQILGKERS